MTKLETPEDAIAIIVDRTQLLNSNQLRQLARSIPVGIQEAIRDFSATCGLSTAERWLLLRHKIDVRWELRQYADAKEQQPNIKVEWPPRNN